MRARSRRTLGLLGAAGARPTSGSDGLDVHRAVAAQAAEAGVHLGAEAARACPRRRVARPHAGVGKRSARYSAIASVSQTAKPSSTSTGTVPAGADRAPAPASERRVCRVEVVEAQLHLVERRCRAAASAPTAASTTTSSSCCRCTSCMGRDASGCAPCASGDEDASMRCASRMRGSARASARRASARHAIEPRARLCRAPGTSAPPPRARPARCPARSQPGQRAAGDVRHPHRIEVVARHQRLAGQQLEQAAPAAGRARRAAAAPAARWPDQRPARRTSSAQRNRPAGPAHS